MYSALSSVITDFFMKHIEEDPIRITLFKPKCWPRYVDDTFIVPHGNETHTNRYLDAKSHLVGQRTIKTLVHRVYTLADGDQCDKELEHLQYVFLVIHPSAKINEILRNLSIITRETENKNMQIIKRSYDEGSSHHVKSNQ